MHQNLAATPGVTHPNKFSGCCDHIFGKRFGAPPTVIVFASHMAHTPLIPNSIHHVIHNFASHMGATRVATGQAKHILDDSFACVLTARLGWEIHSWPRLYDIPPYNYTQHQNKVAERYHTLLPEWTLLICSKYISTPKERLFGHVWAIHQAREI